MRKNIGIILFFLLSINIFSQTNDFNNLIFHENYLHYNKKDTFSIKKKNLFCVEVNYIGLSFNYAHRIRESRWFIGGGAGIGLSKYSFGYMIAIIDECRGFVFDNMYFNHEFLHLECFANYLKSKYLMLETGIRASGKMWEEEEGIGLFLGGYVKLMIGLRNFKLGPIMEISTLPYPPIFYSTLLFRYNFTF